MIDNVKGQIFGITPDQIRNNPRLWLKYDLTVRNNGSSIITHKENYISDNVSFFIFNNQTIRFNFSLHKFSHNGNNYDDFSMQMLRQALSDFSTDFQINLKEAYLNGIEIGVNIKTKLPPCEIIDRLISHRYKPFEKLINPDVFYMAICKRQRFWVKIYDKSSQVNRPGRILRFEVKIRKMQHIKNLSIRTLDDLTDITKVKGLKKVLFSSFANILIKPKTFRLSQLSQHNQRFLKKASTKEYWDALKETPRKFQYMHRKYRQLHNAGDNLKPLLEKQIKQKWWKLLYK